MSLLARAAGSSGDIVPSTASRACSGTDLPQGSLTRIAKSAFNVGDPMHVPLDSVNLASSLTNARRHGCLQSRFDHTGEVRRLMSCVLWRALYFKNLGEVA